MTHSPVTRKPRIWMFLWLACLGGLVGLGCQELGNLLVAQFPGAKHLIGVGVGGLFGAALAQVSIVPLFAELGRPLR